MVEALSNATENGSFGFMNGVHNGDVHVRHVHRLYVQSCTGLLSFRQIYN